MAVTMEKTDGEVMGRPAVERKSREEMTLGLQLEKLCKGPGERRPRQREQLLWMSELAKNLA